MIKIGGLIVSKGSEFLPEVLGLIEKRLGEIDKNIQAVRQDINSMNEYYWDNYTEMDQYGYEDYDNQQALKMQVNANQENWKMRRRLKRMLDAPFFGSVEFAYAVTMESLAITASSTLLAIHSTPRYITLPVPSLLFISSSTLTF